MTADSGKLALVLGGGGARAAYQVGFLRSVARRFPDLHFPVLTGVSAGAINIAYLANCTDDFPQAIDQLTALWKNITADHVFRTDLSALGINMMRWAFRLVSGGSHLLPPTRGMVDTVPLRHFLRSAFGSEDGVLRGIDENIRRGRLSAVGVTTTHYGTGQSITWVQGDDIAAWERRGRRSLPTTLTVDHVMASCALPLFFPAVQVGHDWHGDGGVQLTAPLSPALHLGAERIIAISTRYMPSQIEAGNSSSRRYPPPATVIGILLDAIFLDMLDYDAMNMQRLNQLLIEHPKAKESGLRPVKLLLLRPSQDLGMIAHEFESELPKIFRFATRGLGTRESKHADLLATLLFQSGYTHRMIEIGEQDGERRHEEIAAFLGK